VDVDGGSGGVVGACGVKVDIEVFRVGLADAVLVVADAFEEFLGKSSKLSLKS
jgi:hypothetical protein